MTERDALLDAVEAVCDALALPPLVEGRAVAIAVDIYDHAGAPFLERLRSVLRAANGHPIHNEVLMMLLSETWSRNNFNQLICIARRRWPGFIENGAFHTWWRNGQ